MGKKRGFLQKKVEQPVERKVKGKYEYKSLSPELMEKSILASEAQIYKLNKEGKTNEPIMLQISTLLPTSNSKEKDYTRRMIVLPNKLKNIKDTSILLITKDPVDTYRLPLTESDSPTRDTFTDIIGYKRFKNMVGTSKKALKTFHEYDIVITDNRLHSILPKLLEPTIFCKSSQNFPLMIQMAKQDPDVQLVKPKKSSKMKDERVDSTYVQSQMKSWCKNTTFVPSTGSEISIVVGYPNMRGEQISENIDSVITFLTQKEFKPIGGIIHEGINGILGMYLYANDKSVPIMKKV